jgi:hypothetical protein
LKRAFDRFADVGPRREVQDARHGVEPHQTNQLARLSQIQFREVGLALDGGPMPARHVVDCHIPVAAFEQQTHGMRSDVNGPAGGEDG